LKRMSEPATAYLTEIPRVPGRRFSFLHSKKIAPYVYVLPFIVSFLLFFAYPIFSTIQMSFQEVLPGAVRYIGLRNYERLFNPTFYRAVSNSLLYTVLTLIVLIPLPLLLAVMLDSRRMFFRNFFRSSLFIPALTSVVVAGTIFRLIFGELKGSAINEIVGLFGMEPRRWLFDRGFGMFALVLLATWRWLGVNIVYYLSGLQSIPRELYEAAEIDGASAWDKLARITVPLLRPVTIYVLTISIYGGLAMFTESYMLWAGNNSPNNIDLTMVGYIYQQGIEQFNLGFGSAIGLTLLAVTMTLNLIQLRFFGLFRRED